MVPGIPGMMHKSDAGHFVDARYLRLAGDPGGKILKYMVRYYENETGETGWELFYANVRRCGRPWPLFNGKSSRREEEEE